jgi:hypothetical protein
VRLRRRKAHSATRAGTGISITLQDVRLPAPHLNLRRSLSKRDESDPVRCAAELVQRGRLILDVSAADLEAAEAMFGAFHPTTWHFRNSLSEAQ